jgi:hypothetical protein
LSYQAVEPKAGALPAPAHRALIDPEQLGDLRLRPSVVEHQPDHLALLGWQLLDRLVEAPPQFEFLAVIGAVRGLGQAGAVAVVRGARQGKPGEAVGGEAAGQVEQLPANVLCCQVEEMAGRFGTKVVQRVQQADQAALEHVKGFLTGKIDEATTFDGTDFRNTIPRFTAENRKANQALVELIGRVGERKEATPAQVALAWLLARKPWIVPIPGTTKLHRLEENLAAASVELTPDDLREIETAASQVAVHGARYPEHLERMTGR